MYYWHLLATQDGSISKAKTVELVPGIRVRDTKVTPLPRTAKKRDRKTCFAIIVKPYPYQNHPFQGVFLSQAGLHPLLPPQRQPGERCEWSGINMELLQYWNSNYRLCMHHNKAHFACVLPHPQSYLRTSCWYLPPQPGRLNCVGLHIKKTDCADSDLNWVVGRKIHKEPQNLPHLLDRRERKRGRPDSPRLSVTIGLRDSEMLSFLSRTLTSWCVPPLHGAGLGCSTRWASLLQHQAAPEAMCQLQFRLNKCCKLFFSSALLKWPPPSLPTSPSVWSLQDLLHLHRGKPQKKSNGHMLQKQDEDTFNI